MIKIRIITPLLTNLSTQILLYFIIKEEKSRMYKSVTELKEEVKRLEKQLDKGVRTSVTNCKFVVCYLK